MHVAAVARRHDFELRHTLLFTALWHFDSAQHPPASTWTDITRAVTEPFQLIITLPWRLPCRAASKDVLYGTLLG